MSKVSSQLLSYWAHSLEELFTTLQSSTNGLSSAAGQERLQKVGHNELQAKKDRSPVVVSQPIQKPLVLILVFAAIIIAIVIASPRLGFIQEHNAKNSIKKLRQQVTFKVTVLRNSTLRTILAEEVVPDRPSRTVCRQHNPCRRGDGRG